MKVYVSLVTGLPGLEDLLERKLVFNAKCLTQDNEQFEFLVDEEAIADLGRLSPSKNYAIEYEGIKGLSYFYLKAYEIEDTIPMKIKFSIQALSST